MSLVGAVVVLAVVPGCDRVFGLTDTEVSRDTDGGGDDDPGAPTCDDMLCTVLAAGQADASSSTPKAIAS